MLRGAVVLMELSQPDTVINVTDLAQCVSIFSSAALGVIPARCF